MGFFAAAIGGEDTAPAESFALPPAGRRAEGHDHRPRHQRARRRGRSRASRVGWLGGLSTYTRDDRRRRPLHDRRRPGGHLPEGRRGRRRLRQRGHVAVGQRRRRRSPSAPCCRRDWAASQRRRDDHRQQRPRVRRVRLRARTPPSTSRSAPAGRPTPAREKYLVVQLPAAIDVTQFALDPAETCGDAATSATAGYRVETSPDGTDLDRRPHRHLHQRRPPHAQPPHADRRRDRRPLRPPDAAVLPGRRGAPFRDLSEFGVYGTAGRTTPRRSRDTTLEPGGPPFVFSSSEPGDVRVQASTTARSRPARRPSHAGAQPTARTRSPCARSDADRHPRPDARDADLHGRHDRAGDDDRPAGAVRAVRVLLERAGATFECKGRRRCASRRARRRDARVARATATHTFTVRATDAAGQRRRDAGDADVHGRHDGAGDDDRRRAAGRAHAPRSRSRTTPSSTFECKLDGGRRSRPCTSPRTLAALGRRRAHVLGARDRRGRQRRPDAGDADVHGRHGGAGDDDRPRAVSAVPRSPRTTPARRSSASSTTAAFAACTSPRTSRVLADGEHTFSVRAIDAAGNVDPTPATRTFTVDTVGAGDDDRHRADRDDARHAPMFTFSPARPGATFECKLDGPGAGTFAPCTSPRDARAARGRRVHVRGARDRRGRATSIRRRRRGRFTVDTSAAGDDARERSDGPTNDNTPTFTFTSTRAGLDVRVQARRGAVEAVHVAADARRRSPTAPHTFSVARDRRRRATSTRRRRRATFTVDTAAPETTHRRAARVAVHVLRRRAGLDVRVHARRAARSRLHVAARRSATLAGRRAHVLGPRDRRGRQRRPDAGDADVHGRHGRARRRRASPARPAASNDTTPHVRRSRSDGRTPTFECKLDAADARGAFAACTSPRDVRPARRRRPLHVHASARRTPRGNVGPSHATPQLHDLHDGAADGDRQRPDRD